MFEMFVCLQCVVYGRKKKHSRTLNRNSRVVLNSNDDELESSKGRAFKFLLSFHI